MDSLSHGVCARVEAVLLATGIMKLLPLAPLPPCMSLADACKLLFVLQHLQGLHQLRNLGDVPDNASGASETGNLTAPHPWKHNMSSLGNMQRHVLISSCHEQRHLVCSFVAEAILKHFDDALRQ